jgi:tetratricopeptide (TPR) repeat protein
MTPLSQWYHFVGARTVLIIEARPQKLGEARFRQGRYDDAIEECTAAIKAQPEMAEPLWTLSFVYQDLMMTERLLETLLKLASICTNDPNVHWNLGHAYAAAGDLESAIKEYSFACQLEPGRLQYARSLANTLRKLRDQSAATG